MQRSPHPVDGSAPAAPAFAMTEAAAVVAIAFLLAALLLITSGDTRRQARLGEDIAKLRQFAVATGSYSADNSDQFWSFSWKKGQALSQWPELNNAPSDLQAAANQAVDILRRKAGMEVMQPMLNWYPYLQYSHLPLSEYLGSPFPNLAAVSSMDKHRLKWARHPWGFITGQYQPAPTGPTAPGTAAGKRWPFSSSFQLDAAFFDGSAGGVRIYQGYTQTQFFVPPQVVLGGRPLSEVAFPAHKVHLHDRSAWHFGRVAYCTHDQARLPLLFTDGAVSVRAAVDANPGWQANQPNSPSPSSFLYQPDVWEPSALSGGTSDAVIGRFRWTRGCPNDAGLKGRDIGAPEPCPPLP